MNPHAFNLDDPFLREIFERTDILRKPISGIVSGYHELPYVLVAPDEQDTGKSIEVSGKISVSPRFVITPSQLSDTFGEIFDPETFDQEIQGRLFSFGYARGKNLKVASDHLSIEHHTVPPRHYLEQVLDGLQMREDVRTALIYGPRFGYYPVSLDRFLSEILDREFRL